MLCANSLDKHYVVVYDSTVVARPPQQNPNKNSNFDPSRGRLWC